MGGGDGCIGTRSTSSSCSSLASTLARPRVDCTSRSRAIKRSRLARSFAHCLSTIICICLVNKSCNATIPSNRNVMSRRSEDIMGGGGDGGGATTLATARRSTEAAGLPEDCGGRPCTFDATSRAMADCSAGSVKVGGEAGKFGVIASCESVCAFVHACVAATVAFRVPKMPGLEVGLFRRCTVGRKLYPNDMS